jgi:hypothetical protein
VGSCSGTGEIAKVGVGVGVEVGAEGEDTLGLSGVSDIWP